MAGGSKKDGAPGRQRSLWRRQGRLCPGGTRPGLPVERELGAELVVEALEEEHVRCRLPAHPARAAPAPARAAPPLPPATGCPGSSQLDVGMLADVREPLQVPQIQAPGEVWTKRRTAAGAAHRQRVHLGFQQAFLQGEAWLLRHRARQGPVAGSSDQADPDLALPGVEAVVEDGRLVLQLPAGVGEVRPRG